MNESAPQKIPTFDDRSAMWKSLEFAPDDAIYPLTKAYVSALEATYAKVLHLPFRVPNHPIYDWYASRNQFHEMGFFERFWSTPLVSTCLPQTLKSVNFFSLEIFKGCSPFMLAGGLACCLAEGGAYGVNRPNAMDAKRLGDGVADEWIQSRYDSSLLYIANSAWSDYFYDVAWDYTWVLINKSVGTIHVILATDTD
jgi:hypothetical protein